VRRFLGPVLTATGALRARWSVVIVMVPSVLIGALGLLYTVRVQGEFNCQARYNTAFQQRSIVLSQVAAEDRQNTVTLMRSVTQAKKPADVRAALDAYLTTNDRLERERDKHPFPQVPEQRCA
jgi:hypothetical protein